MRAGIVSLCTGTGQLDAAVTAVTGEEVIAYAEFDETMNAWFGKRHPEALSLTDLRQINWHEHGLTPKILTAGYPCQPFSQAGRKLGEEDPRHLWPEVLRAIRELGPELVVLENVRNHLRIGFDQVLGDLAAIGFDAEWSIVRADEVGAPHQRARIYVTAWPADADGE